MNTANRIKSYFKTSMKKKCPVFFAVVQNIKRPFNPIIHWLIFGSVGYDTILVKMSYVKSILFPSLPSRYSRMKTLKDIHKGQKIFIAATGPSLTAEDLDMLKGHLSMGVNSIPMSYDKTEWRPDYYVIIDSVAAENVINNMGESYDLWHSIDPSHIIVPHYFRRFFDLPEEVMLCRYWGSNVKISDFRFSDDCYLRVFDGSTVVFTCLQLAVYMGCSEIYLLGVDCNYTGSNDHAFGFNVGEQVNRIQRDKGAEIAYRMTCAYQVAKKYADAHGVKIFNATRGGKLEVFPRISLEEALKD